MTSSWWIARPGRVQLSDNALLACQRVLAPAEMHEAFMPAISGVMMQLRSLGRVFEVSGGYDRVCAGRLPRARPMKRPTWMR